MYFKNRAEAGQKLAAALARYKSSRPIVMALPRGGVPVAAEVAEALGAPLGIILVRKIGAPQQPELAVGAVVDGQNPVIVRNPDVLAWTHTSEAQFQQICKQELAEIERRRKVFLGNRAPLNLEGRVTIVIDDGIATGATMRVALEAMRKHNPKKLVLAVPVASQHALRELRALSDEIVSLTDLGTAGAVGMFYDDFEQLSDSDVTHVLDRLSAPRAAHAQEISSELIRIIAGDIDASSISEILRLKPSIVEIEDAAHWARGDGDIPGKQRHMLRGNAAAIYDILMADEDEPESGRVPS